MILVSVCMITYNHESFIKQAIEGVLMQQCDFKVELIIADDNSPDGTKKIVESFKSHPNASWIKYIKHSHNKGMISNFCWTLMQSKGKYIALCEGDDFWTDPLKLQNQVDLLEADTNNVICGSLAEIVNELSIAINKFNNYEKLMGALEDVKYRNPLITCTVLFRNELNEITFPKHIVYGDWWLYHHLLQNEKSRFVVENKYYAAYRKHSGGITSIHSDVQKKQALINQLIQFSKFYKYKLDQKQLLILSITHYKLANIHHRNMSFFKLIISLFNYFYFMTLYSARKVLLKCE